MPITFGPSFFDSTGQAHKTLIEAQERELNIILNERGDMKATATLILENAEKIVDILTTTKNSRPKARKVNGGTKKRTPKPAAEKPAELPLATAKELAKDLTPF